MVRQAAESRGAFFWIHIASRHFPLTVLLVIALLITWSGQRRIYGLCAYLHAKSEGTLNPNEGIGLTASGDGAETPP
ncbi:hypothetical protein A6R70_15620 [Agrobacterium rubi]|nr:hypothetical protein [Agrobacterium rubi]